MGRGLAAGGSSHTDITAEWNVNPPTTPSVPTINTHLVEYTVRLVTLLSDYLTSSNFK